MGEAKHWPLEELVLPQIICFLSGIMEDPDRARHGTCSSEYEAGLSIFQALPISLKLLAVYRGLLPSTCWLVTLGEHSHLASLAGLR